MAVVNKVLAMLGLCRQANRLVSGEFQTEKAVKEQKAKLVIVAEDASENTKKLFRNKCTFYKVPCRLYGEKEMLGHAIGKEMRSSLAILDEGFANEIMIRIDDT